MACTQEEPKLLGVHWGGDKRLLQLYWRAFTIANRFPGYMIRQAVKKMRVKRHVMNNKVRSAVARMGGDLTAGHVCAHELPSGVCMCAAIRCVYVCGCVRVWVRLCL